MHKDDTNGERSACTGIGKRALEPSSLPHFKHEPPSVHSQLGRIFVGDQVFHQIVDPTKFYETFGQKRDSHQSDSFAEEFLWDRYRRDEAKMSKQCFNSQVAVYLHRYSDEFRELFAATYHAMIGKCHLDCVDGGDEHCAKCPMHPR